MLFTTKQIHSKNTQQSKKNKNKKKNKIILKETRKDEKINQIQRYFTFKQTIQQK